MAKKVKSKTYNLDKELIWVSGENVTYPKEKIVDKVDEKGKVILKENGEPETTVTIENANMTLRIAFSFAIGNRWGVLNFEGRYIEGLLINKIGNKEKSELELNESEVNFLIDAINVSQVLNDVSKSAVITVLAAGDVNVFKEAQKRLDNRKTMVPIPPAIQQQMDLQNKVEEKETGEVEQVKKE